MKVSIALLLRLMVMTQSHYQNQKTSFTSTTLANLHKTKQIVIVQFGDKVLYSQRRGK